MFFEQKGDGVHYTSGELQALFNQELSLFKQDFITRMNLDKIPDIQNMLPENGIHQTLLGAYVCICCEIIMNIADHADFVAMNQLNEAVQVKLTEMNTQTVITVENICKRSFIPDLETAKRMRGRSRISGTRAIELYQELIGVEFWDFIIVNKTERRVKMVYPVALKSKI